MGIREYAEAALADNYRLTADYAFSTEGLIAGPKILSHVKRVLKKQAADPLDQLTEDQKYFDLIKAGEFGRYGAAEKLGLDPVRVMRRIKVDEDFRDRVHVAEAASLEKIAKKMRELAEDGEKWAVLKMLESKNPDEYNVNPKNNGMNVSIGTLNVGNTDPISAELRELEAELRSQQELRKGQLPVIDAESEEL